MLPLLLQLGRVIGVVVCLVLTGAAVLVPEHPWLQLLASASCAVFAWIFGLPPGVLLAAALARMRPERLADAVTRATKSMPPERAQLVLESLPPPARVSAAVPPVPIVFEGEPLDGWEEPPEAMTPAVRPPRKH